MGHRRNLFHFDPDDVAGVEPAAESAVAEAPPPDPAPDPEPTPSEWAGVSQDEWERTQQFIAAAGPFLQNLAYEQQQAQYVAQQQQPQGPELPEWDPFDPAVVEAHVSARVQAAIEQALGPFQPILGQVAQETSMRQAESALEGLSSQVGNFDRDAALLIAAPMIDAGNMPETSLRAAAQYMHDLEQRIRADERQVVQNELRELQEAGPQAGSSGAPGVTATEFDKVPTGPNRYEEAISRAIARRRGGFPVG